MNISEALLARLKSVKGRDGCYTAQCPAHADSSPSMRITVFDSRILIHCFAGCTPKSVLEAVGLSFSDLFRDPLSPLTNYQELKKSAAQEVAEWVETRMMELATMLRARDEVLLRTDGKSDMLARTWRAHCLRDYSRLEWEFETLRTGTTEEKVRLWRER